MKKERYVYLYCASVKVSRVSLVVRALPARKVGYIKFLRNVGNYGPSDKDPHHSARLQATRVAEKLREPSICST
jgi:hypothetical protein